MALINVTSNKGESFESLFRRFKNSERSSGKQLTLRAGRYFTKKTTKQKQHDKALRGLKKQEKIAYLLQSGKITPSEIRNVK